MFISYSRAFTDRISDAFGKVIVKYILKKNENIKTVV